jgi:SPP1 gp7 family putative phage head morphogenesis protein
MNVNVNGIVVRKVADKMTAKTEKAVVSAYKAGLDAIRNQLASVYQKYEQNGVLTFAEMAKYNRYSAMLEGMNKTLKDITGASGQEIKKLSANVYQESYYRTAYAIEKTVQTKLSYGLLNPKVIQAAVENPIAGLTLSESLKANRASIITSIKSNIIQGLMQGESYKTMADRVKTVLDNDAAKAMRIVRTEAGRAKSAGTLASMEHGADRGVKMKKMWVATQDERTRDTHAELDGQTVDMDEDFESTSGSTGPAPRMFGDPAEDINCRCECISVIEGYEPIDVGRQGEGDEYQSYGEWADSKGIPNNYDDLEPKLSPEETTDLNKWAADSSLSLFNNAVDNEPDITDLVTGIATKNNVKMEGLEYRLKSQQSVERKLKSEFTEKFGTTYNEIEKSIGDTVRYTYVMDDASYASKVAQIKSELEASGLKSYKFKNYWQESTYHGINSNWITEAGQKFEIQFHTFESFNTKQNITHKIYEKMRTTPTKGVLQAKYKQQLSDIWENIDVPIGMD